MHMPLAPLACSLMRYIGVYDKHGIKQRELASQHDFFALPKFRANDFEPDDTALFLDTGDGETILECYPIQIDGITNLPLPAVGVRHCSPLHLGKVAYRSKHHPIRLEIDLRARRVVCQCLSTPSVFF